MRWKSWPFWKLFAYLGPTIMVILWWRDSLNAIYWVASSSLAPWRFHFFVNEFKALASLIHVMFRHVGRAANALVDL